MAKITVIVPVYKVEEYLTRCVDSILSQSFRDFELLLIDDGSPDQSGFICDQYSVKDSRVKVIHQENAGLSGARNTGIDWSLQNSKCEWLTFIDSDDWVYMDYLKALLSNAECVDADISCCGFIRTTGDVPRIDRDHLYGILVDVEDFYINNNVCATIACGKLYKKALFKNTRYPLGKLHEDEYTTYKILFGAKKVVYVDQPLYFYYQNQNGIMRSKWNPKRLDVIGAFEEQIAYFRNSPSVKKSQVKRYEICLYNFICTLENMEEYSNYEITIRARLKKLLIKYHQLVKWEEVPYIAEKVFPRFMKYYWIFLAQLNKIRK